MTNDVLREIEPRFQLNNEDIVVKITKLMITKPEYRFTVKELSEELSIPEKEIIHTIDLLADLDCFIAYI